MKSSIYVKNIYRTCNLTVGFSKYEFNNKLLDNATLLRVSFKKKKKHYLELYQVYLSLCIYIYIYIYYWMLHY